MSTEWRQRPIDNWPGEMTADRRRATFKAAWGATTDLLERELEMLDATGVVILVALEPKDFRIKDGKPRSQARASHPGVIVSFESKFGPLRYACDTFDDYSDNVRAIALGLEALRKVERYGITKRGQQYVGWAALPPATTMGLPMSSSDAARVLLDLADEESLLGYAPTDVTGSDAVVDELWTIAVLLHHPDHAGGNADLFRRANEARAVLQGAAQ